MSSHYKTKAMSMSLFLLLVLVACAPGVKESYQKPSAEKLVWPAPPTRPRLAFVKSVTRPRDLGISKGITQGLREIFTGPRDVRIVRPMAVVASPEGKVFVADPGVRGVHLFDIRHNRYRLIRGRDGQLLPSPVALAISPGGEVYLSDSRLGAVFVIEPGATEAVKVPLQALLARPAGLALEPGSGRLYLVDTGSHEVKVFARDGALLKRFGRRGTGEGEFNFPTMIWLDRQGRLLVADSMNFRIQLFDGAGHYLKQFGGVGRGAGRHAQPKGIATDSRGHIYVVDSLLHGLQIFDPAGAYLLRVGRRGTANGEFWLPAGIFIDGSDTIYIADSYNRRLQIFRYLGGERP